MTALAAAGEVLPDGTGSAADAEEAHCTDRDCAETTIANSSGNSRSFIGGLPERTLVRLTPIMERRGWRAKAPNATYFGRYWAPALIVGWTPASAAGPLAGLSRVASTRFFERRAGPGGPAQTRGSAPPMLQHSRMLAKVSGVGRKRLPHRARKALCTRVGQTLSSVKRRVSVFFFAASKGAVAGSPVKHCKMVAFVPRGFHCRRSKPVRKVTT